MTTEQKILNIVDIFTGYKKELCWSVPSPDLSFISKLFTDKINYYLSMYKPIDTIGDHQNYINDIEMKEQILTLIHLVSPIIHKMNITYLTYDFNVDVEIIKNSIYLTLNINESIGGYIFILYNGTGEIIYPLIEANDTIVEIEGAKKFNHIIEEHCNEYMFNKSIVKHNMFNVNICDKFYYKKFKDKILFIAPDNQINHKKDKL